MEKIVHYSQLKAEQLEIEVELSVVQLKAFIAILYHRGVMHDQKIPLEELWGEHSDDFYRTTMPKNLFKIWSRCIRFDDTTTRSQRYELDTYAAFREIWDDFNNRLHLFFRRVILSLLTNNS